MPAGRRNRRRWPYPSRRARLWENSGRPAVVALASISTVSARQAFPAALGDVGLEEFHFAVNAVEPSLIRVRADEVTYDLHILTRFRLERADRRASCPADLPSAWDEESPGGSWACRRATTPRAACRTATGRRGCSAIFRRTLGNVSQAAAVRASGNGSGRRGPRFRARRLYRLAGLAARAILFAGRPLHGGVLVEEARRLLPDPQPLVASLGRKYEELHESAGCPRSTVMSCW